MNKRRFDLLAVLFIFGGLILLLLVLSRPGLKRTSEWVERIEGDGERIGLVEVIGPIYDSRNWVRDLDRFRRDRRIKGILVRFDSPGGVTAASQELYEAVRRAGDEKPVVASMGNIATSGAYYAALGADTIIANPSTTTGSIGVIIEFTEISDLMHKIGIASEVVKSGKYKDSGNPAREMTPDERAYFQGYIDDAFSQFVQTVARERSLSDEQVLRYADGRVFTGRQAHEYGLVDLLGDQYQAIQLLAGMAGIDGKPTVVTPPRRRTYEWMDLLLDGAVERLSNRLESRGAFQYRWKPETVR